MKKINMENLKMAVKFSVKKAPVITAGVLVIGKIADDLFDNNILKLITIALGMGILTKDAVDELIKADDLEDRIAELEARIAELENK